jgi:hypothetical protein
MIEIDGIARTTSSKKKEEGRITSTTAEQEIAEGRRGNRGNHKFEDAEGRPGEREEGRQRDRTRSWRVEEEIDGIREMWNGGVQRGQERPAGRRFIITIFDRCWERPCT